jgi:uncharacterized integral membrane protein (TIGR00698 family)
MAEKVVVKKPRKPNTLENLFLGCTVQDVPKLIPGVALAALVVVISIWATDWLNAALGFKGLISYILTVIVAGILIRNTLGVPAVFIPGVNFCLRKLLRLGIIMMGIRLSIFDVIKIGAWGIPIIAACVIAGLIITDYFGRLLKVPDRLTALIAVGTSICGASAIVATAPGINAKDEEVAYAVANITIFGILALVVYPFLAHWLFKGNVTMIGLFTGVSIHETAQVAASGMIYNQTFGAPATGLSVADIATISKLVRNTMMMVVIPTMTFLYMRRAGETQSASESGLRKAVKLFPLFVLGFVLFAIFRSIGDAGIKSGALALGIWTKQSWAALTGFINQWSTYILATAMAGVGLGTSFKTMKGLGIKPFYVGLFSATLVGVVAAVMVFLLGRFVIL